MTKLLVILPYHNPCQWHTRKRNYKLCVDRLKKQGADIITIECGYHFQWDTDAEIKTHSQSVIWQKECLITTAIARTDSDYVAWVDHDLLFEDDDWVEKTLTLLKTNDFVQLFSEVRYLRAGETEPTTQPEKIEIIRPGAIASGTGVAPGGAWAARRNCVSFGLYANHITGGGDSFLYSLITQMKLGIGLPYWEYASKAGRQDMMNWAEDFVWLNKRPMVTHLDQPVYHLFHGTVTDRQYTQRHQMLSKYHYDPLNDSAVIDGALEWCSDKKDLHDEMDKYFRCRNEDIWQ